MRMHTKNYKAFADTLIEGSKEAGLTLEQFDKLTKIIARFFEVNNSNFEEATWVAYYKEKF